MKGVSCSMRSIKISILFFSIAFGFFGFYGVGGYHAGAASTGPLPSLTNAPAFGSIPAEATCTECHGSFPLNAAGGSVQITGLPLNYRPGQVIPITVRVSQQNAVTYGFQTLALDRNGINSGTFANQAGRTQIIDGIVGGQQRFYIEHTLSGITPMQFGFNTWTFNWTAPANTRRGKLTLYAAGNATNSDGTTAGDAIYTTTASTYAGTAIGTFDGDGISDTAVYRPSIGAWFYFKSSVPTGDRGFTATSFGQPGDKIVPGDYDGDGKNDLAVFRPANATWFIQNSSTGQFFGAPFGVSTDIPVQGDYDGDGKTDIAVFRPSISTWIILSSQTGGAQFIAFGSPNDIPVMGDYDGDAKHDPAIYRPNGSSGNAEWWILKSTGGVFATPFGSATDKPAVGDYDGDGKTDCAFWRPSSGTWFVLRSSNLSFFAFPFGISTDKIAPGDYDGDGITDAAVFRDGSWFILKTSDGGVKVDFLGSAGDIPVNAGYLPQ